VPRKVRLIVALVLICLPVVAAVVCQVHTMPPDHAHAMPSQGHSSSSEHSLFDFSCMGMAAILPMIVMFAAIFFHMVHVTPLASKHPVLVFPLFIPPRRLTH
jgi:hypothetical protein